MLLFKYLEKNSMQAWKPLLEPYKNHTAGWGRKKSFFKAQALAEEKGLKILCLEDGFIRSLGLGKQGFAALSLVADTTGIYFNALQPSDLEQLIVQPEYEKINQRSSSVIQTIFSHKLTKYYQ